MLDADDAGVVVRSPGMLGSKMTVIVAVCQKLALTISEKEVGAMRLWSVPSSPGTAEHIKPVQAEGRIRVSWWHRQQRREFFHPNIAPHQRYLSTPSATNSMRRLSLKIRSLKAEVVKAMLYRCACYMVSALRQLGEYAHWTQDDFTLGCFRDDQLRACGNNHRQTSTLLHWDPFPTRPNT